MSKRGLPLEIKMRHDVHYVEELAKSRRSIGRMIESDKIEPNPLQPRTEIGDLTDLVSSIKEKGVLEPLLVKPLREKGKWLIIAGERRWRAARLAGLTELPCVEMEIDEREVAEIALIENLQRKDLTVWEEADALADLSLRFAYTHEETAKKIGRSRSSITESLSIAALPQEVRQGCLNTGINSKSAILSIARQFDEQSMFAAIERFKDNVGIKNRQAETFGSRKDAGDDAPATAQKSTPKPSQPQRINYPVKTFSYSAADQEYKLELKFKKPADKEAVKTAIRDALSNLESEID